MPNSTFVIECILRSVYISEQQLSQMYQYQLPLRLISVKMKYFRSYPLGMQLLLFLLMAITVLSSASFIIPTILAKATDVPVRMMAGITPATAANIVNAAIIFQGISNLVIYTCTSLLFAYLATPRPKAYLGLRAPGKPLQPILAIFVMLGAWPILSGIEGLIGHIDFSKEIKAEQLANENTFNAFLNMPDFGAFLKVFVLIAIVPALGEELFFRGVLMRFAKKRSRTMVFPILFTAAIFAYSHANPYGYLSIFLAGALLAVIYNLTGSLWCNIAAHMFFNGTQIILAYLGNNNADVKAFMANNSVPYYLIIAGAIVFSGSLYLLWKNRTPLLPNWADDFTPQELSQKAY